MAGVEWLLTLVRAISLQDYNTRLVLTGTAAFGAAAGLVGVFLLLRKRSLLSDAVSHATLPGIAVAFIAAESAGLSGRSLPLLLVGAGAFGLLGMAMVVAVRNWSRIKDDAAMAIVLGVFFGLGVALITLIQQMPGGNAAGIDHFIYGKAASMTALDARWILGVASVSILVCVALFKEFSLLCFDEAYASAQGWPVRLLDSALMGLVVLITVVGLQAVGLLLVVAMLIIPAAASRFWSHNIVTTAALSTGFGMLSAGAGVVLSASYPRMPAGSLIVLSGTSVFLFSMAFGAKRGLLVRAIERIRVMRRVRRQHVLRAMYEALEPTGSFSGSVSSLELAKRRAWNRKELRRAIAQVTSEGLVARVPDGTYTLTGEGRHTARRVVRNHRLWEIYLVTYADIAPNVVDRDADAIEHVIDPQVVDELEEILERERGNRLVPDDPHGAAKTEESQRRVSSETQVAPTGNVPPSP